MPGLTQGYHATQPFTEGLEQVAIGSTCQGCWLFDLK